MFGEESSAALYATQYRLGLDGEKRLTSQAVVGIHSVAMVFTAWPFLCTPMG